MKDFSTNYSKFLFCPYVVNPLFKVDFSFMGALHTLHTREYAVTEHKSALLVCGR